MKPKYFLLLFLLLFSNNYLLLTQSRINRDKDLKRDGESLQNPELSKIFNSEQLRLEGSTISGDYVIGPEIAISGATGFYDYQTNGDCKHYIKRDLIDVLHAIFVTATDSNDIVSSRRTVYCGSTNDGSTWFSLGEVPSSLRSGFASLTSVNGQAVICNHYLVSGLLRGSIALDVVPLAGSFTLTPAPYNIAWPQCSILSNNLVMVAGETYHSGAGTDTCIVSVYNTSNNTFSNTTRFQTGLGVDQANMRWISASGPNGNALYLLDPLSDIGGTNGYNRLFITKTSNYGVNWSLPMTVFYDPQVLLSEFAIPFFGLDAIYDSFGNYYIAFNTTNETGDYASARLWVSKNGGTPVLVASHQGLHGIPEAAETVLSPQAGICTIDHPSLSISSDGLILYVSYGVLNENDILNSFNKSHIYISTSLTSTLEFGEPVRVTNSGANSFDERYCSIAQTTPNLGGGQGRTVFMVYQKDPQPGSGSFNDLAPISRASLIFRKITDLSYPITNINNNNSSIPTESKLLQNYPNPFNPGTQIRFEISSRSNVVLSVYDINGKFISTIYSNSATEPGSYSKNFDGTVYSSGIYLIIMDIRDGTGTILKYSKKMLLIK
ncbi:MAG: T9SS type A sorting domain-containing protein [Ignavibacteria bacterium]